MPPAPPPEPAPLDLGPHARRVRRSMGGEHPGETGTMLPPLIDHHVHLMLVGPDELRESALAGVVDLGGPLDAIAAYARRGGVPHIAFAGSFLTAPGGYPLDRPWAAPGSVREISVAAGDERAALPSAAETAVGEQLAFGASVIKVVLNAVAGPVLDAATLAAVVTSAHDAGVQVVAHVEGDGMSRLAIDAGVDALAHTPFTERLDDELIARAVAAGQRWISTLFVAGYGRATPEAAIALENLGRFHAAGGRVLYGTDLGNGEQPLGVNPAELALLIDAGLEASALVDALTDPWPAAADAIAFDGAVASFVPGAPPARLDALPAWLASARIHPAEDLQPYVELEHR